MDGYYEPDSLFQAVSNNDLPQIKKLIASKCNVNEVDEIEGPVLSLALADSNPDIEIVKVLLAAQADPNLHTDIYQHTPFQEYSRQCHPDPAIVELLLQSGANANIISGLSGRSSVHEFYHTKNYSILNLLQQYGADINQLRGPNAHILIADSYKFIIYDDSYNSSKVEEGDSILHHACKIQNYDAIEHILSVAGDLHLANSQGISAYQILASSMTVNEADFERKQAILNR